MVKLLINSIYRATEGEGIWVGTPQIFVRLQGCAVGCVNCDSKETWAFNQNMAVELEQVLDRVEMLAHQGTRPLRRVSLTGGDPLHPQHVPSLIVLARELKMRGYQLNIEASGTRVVEELFDIVDHISMDFKTPSTGVRTHASIVLEAHRRWPQKLQMKAVIADNADFAATFELREKVMQETSEFMVPWVLTPCFEPGESFPRERFEYIAQLNEQWGGPFRVVGQQHKWVYGPDRRQV